MLGYNKSEWKQFSPIEKRILRLKEQYKMEDERVRMILTFPEPPMLKRTYDNHLNKISNLIAQIRVNRRQSIEFYG